MQQIITSIIDPDEQYLVSSIYILKNDYLPHCSKKVADLWLMWDSRSQIRMDQQLIADLVVLRRVETN